MCPFVWLLLCVRTSQTGIVGSSSIRAYFSKIHLNKGSKHTCDKGRTTEECRELENEEKHLVYFFSRLASGKQKKMKMKEKPNAGDAI